MIGSQASPGAGAVVMCCSPEPLRTWDCVLECTCGWGLIGMSRIPQTHCSCRYAVMSASELHSSFGYISENGGTMKRKSLALLLLLGCVFVPALEAQIRHVEMRVEVMT